MNALILNTLSASSLSLLLFITVSQSQSVHHQEHYKYKYDGYARDRDRDRYGNVNDFSVIEDSFYRPRKGDIIIEEIPNQYDYSDDERHEKYYQKSPKYETRVSVASSH